MNEEKKWVIVYAPNKRFYVGLSYNRLSGEEDPAWSDKGDIGSAMKFDTEEQAIATKNYGLLYLQKYSCKVLAVIKEGDEWKECAD